MLRFLLEFFLTYLTRVLHVQEPSDLGQYWLKKSPVHEKRVYSVDEVALLAELMLAFGCYSLV